MAEAHDETMQLLTCWHDGDRDALMQLLDRDRQWIESRIRARRGTQLRQHAETNDDIQDLMVDALEYSPRFVAANRKQFRGLLARMIENRLTDRARGLQRRGKVETFRGDSRLSLNPDLAARQPTEPAAAAIRNEELEWMRLGLEFLDADDRALVFRRQFAEQSFIEIAEADGIAADAIRMRFHRAVLRLAGIVQTLQAGNIDGILQDD